jgi:hypothetical protein
MSTGRIDFHQHVVPPFWAEALAADGGDPSGWSSPAWIPENAIVTRRLEKLGVKVRTGVKVEKVEDTPPGPAGSWLIARFEAQAAGRPTQPINAPSVPHQALGAKDQ